jgi:uncharacterized protein GlcG (DUF336 family)
VDAGESAEFAFGRRLRRVHSPTGLPRVNSQRKAYTARTFSIPAGEFAQRVKDNPSISAVHLTGAIAAQGALPIKVGDEVIGAVGVSGAPGGEKDEACAKAGIDKVADQLK